MNNNKMNFKLVNLLIIVLIIAVLYFISGLWVGIFNKMVAVLFPFLLAFGVAYAMYPFCKKLERCGIPKWLAIAILYFVVIGLIITMFIIVVPMFYDQTVLFLSNISAVITDISSKYSIDLGVIQTSLSDISSDILKDVGSHISDGAISVLNTSINVITNLIIVVIVSVYFLWDMDAIRNGVRCRLKKKKNRSYAYVKRLDREIDNYFSGLLKNMLIQFVEYTVVFFLIGHPNYLILGILAAVTNIIPYFGGLIINILALVIASVVSTKLFILTLIVCLVCPQIDGYIVSPRIYGKTNQLHPLVNIFAVFAGGILGGLWGIVISLPIAIVLIATVKFFKEDINNKIETIKEKKMEDI